jgi:RNA polymerase sigma-70 factor, ECF subfamily
MMSGGLGRIGPVVRPSGAPRGDAVGSSTQQRAEHFRELCDDERAFRGWYDVALPKVYGFVLSRCGGMVATAEELTQEAFVEAVRHRHRFDGRSDPVTWVVAIARHKLADHFRRIAREERRHLSLVSAAATEGSVAPDPAAAADGRRDVARALAEMPETQRAVVVYRYLDDLSVAEIARRIGRSPSATESLLTRGRERLRRELGIEDAGGFGDA